MSDRVRAESHRPGVQPSMPCHAMPYKTFRSTTIEKVLSVVNVQRNHTTGYPHVDNRLSMSPTGRRACPGALPTQHSNRPAQPPTTSD